MQALTMHLHQTRAVMDWCTADAAQEATLARLVGDAVRTVRAFYREASAMFPLGDEAAVGLQDLVAARLETWVTAPHAPSGWAVSAGPAVSSCGFTATHWHALAAGAIRWYHASHREG